MKTNRQIYIEIDSAARRTARVHRAVEMENKVTRCNWKLAQLLNL